MKELLNIIIVTTISIATYSAQIVSIPDANFKSYLIGNSSINTNADTEIQLSEAQTFTGAINCVGFSISDLTGIEAFISLNALDCNNNQLSNLDVSSNTLLENLNCGNNQLTNLNLNSNTLLQYLNCTNNLLGTLDITSNTSLIYLSIYNNNITNIDVSQNTQLTNVWCMFNPLLTSLDFSQNGNLVFLQANNCSLNYLNLSNGNNVNFISAKTNNNNLTCIRVDDAPFSNANWTTNDFSKDALATYSESCSGTSVIETTYQATIKLFPNPVFSILNIETTKNEMIYFMNTIGEIVHQEHLVSGVNTFSLNHLENGMYFIQTENGITQKFIKQ